MAGVIVQFRLTPQEVEVLESLGDSSESIGIIAKQLIQTLIAEKMERNSIQPVDSSIQDELPVSRRQAKELIEYQTGYIIPNVNELVKQQNEELAKLREDFNALSQKVEELSKPKRTRKAVAKTEE